MFTVQSTPYGVIYLSDDGVRLFDGNQSQVISQEINPDLLPLDDAKLSQYRSSFNIKKQRYELHTPSGDSWVFELQFRRWFLHKGRIDASSIFPLQNPPNIWDSSHGTWDSEVGSWDTASLGAQRGIPVYYAQGSKLGVEDDTIQTRFDVGFTPSWEAPRPTGDELSRQFLKDTIELVYEGAGMMRLFLPNANGAYTEWGEIDFASGDDPVNTRVVAPNQTGRGLGIKLELVEGNVALRRVAVHAYDAGPFIGPVARAIRYGGFSFGDSARFG
jgi:hypothetical protein